MKYKLIAFSLILAGLFSTSCLQEDHSDCYRTYKLIFSYKGDGTTEIFPEKINRVEMYVFDEANACVSSSLLADSDVAARSTRLPHLKPGNYRIICVGNTHNTGLENLDSQDYSKILFASKDHIAGNVTAGNDSLYYASRDVTVIGFDPSVSEEVVDVNFASSHYDVFVELKNAPTWVGNNPKVEITGVSPYTDFENIAKGAPVNYVMETEYHGNGITTAVNNIMRHKNHEDVYLKVTGVNGEIAALINFAEHIEKNKDIINPSLNECLIPFSIEWEVGIGLGEVTIGVPDWIVENIIPDFQKPEHAYAE